MKIVIYFMKLIKYRRILVMKRLEDYIFDFDCICKDILVNGADEEKMQENVDKLDALEKKVELHYKVVEMSDIDAKLSMLNRINYLRGGIVMLRDRIHRFIDTDSFTHYLSVVKMCVNEIE